MTNKLPPYTYKDFETGKIRKTRGRFQGWTKPTGLMNVRYAIFKNPRGDVLVPEPLLTPETKNRIGKADEPKAITPKPPAGSGLQMQSSFGGGGGQTHFKGGSPKRKGKKAAKKNLKKKEKKGSGSLAAFGVMPEGQTTLPVEGEPTVDSKKFKEIAG